MPDFTSSADKAAKIMISVILASFALALIANFFDLGGQREWLRKDNIRQHALLQVEYAKCLNQQVPAYICLEAYPWR